MADSSKKGGGGTPNQRFIFPKWKDLNAMDIDAMSIDKRTHLMKEGKCFNCEQTGHLEKDCPRKELKQEQKKKMEGKQLYAHIRALYKDMDEEEQEEFMKEAEQAGF